MSAIPTSSVFSFRAVGDTCILSKKIYICTVSIVFEYSEEYSTCTGNSATVHESQISLRNFEPDERYALRRYLICP